MHNPLVDGYLVTSLLESYGLNEMSFIVIWCESNQRIVLKDNLNHTAEKRLSEETFNNVPLDNWLK